jgi:hypothetical protein
LHQPVQAETLVTYVEDDGISLELRNRHTQASLGRRIGFGSRRDLAECPHQCQHVVCAVEDQPGRDCRIGVPGAKAQDRARLWRELVDRTSPFLTPWRDLRPEWQEVDRNMVRAIPEVLRAVGWRVYRKPA